MIFETPTQFAILGLCLIAGWLFGLASAPGGKRAKARLRELEAEHTAYRKEAEARIRAAEAERDRLARAAPVTAQMTGTTAAASTASAASAARPARSGFFGWGGDNLSRIRGIDEATERALHGEGIKTYAAIEALSSADEAALEDRLGLGRGRIAEQHWREQAAMLREGRDDEHGARWRAV
jgi:predicted flap endonuclease-1-like 5' DNA nuclease